MDLAEGEGRHQGAMRAVGLGDEGEGLMDGLGWV